MAERVHLLKAELKDGGEILIELWGPSTSDAQPILRTSDGLAVERNRQGLYEVSELRLTIRSLQPL